MSAVEEVRGPAGRIDRVPVSLIQRAVEESGEELAIIAWRMGWTERESRSRRERPATSRLKRALGLAPESRHKKPATTMREETACLVLRAIHVYPRDVGL